MTTPTRPDIDAIRQRAEAATPGPWMWHGNVENWTIRLATCGESVQVALL